MGGLKPCSRKFYEEEIYKAFKRYKRLSTRDLIAELRKNPQRRYPIETKRIVAILKEFRYKRLIKFHLSECKSRHPSEWIFCEGEVE
jgi:hypothetical protein